MNKQEIMRMANNIIEALRKCEDGEFVDEVIAAISFGESFYESEIEDA